MIAANLGGALMATESDKAAILAVLEAETNAYLRRDFEALAIHWVHSPQTRRLVAFASLGTHVEEGWEVIGARLRNIMSNLDKTYPRERLRRENVNVVVGKDMAWVSYDQIGIDAGDEFGLSGVQHELKIFHRVDGSWKIACLVLMQRGVEHATCPLIEVDIAGKVLWMNRPAEERISAHAGLIVASGRLRARRRASEAALGEAILWAFRQLNDHPAPAVAARMSRLVQLGDDDEGDPCFCWVVLDDGKALVTFDDARIVARRIETARQAYGLSPAQARLARLIAEGHDLAVAAESLGVSVNTVRTHLQRMFDRTGARSQAALVRALLSAEVPNK